MICSTCRHENRAGRKFCAECGAALALACTSCGTLHEAGEKFCGECGASLGSAERKSPVSPDTGAPSRPAPSMRAGADVGARKVVTIVFADLVGSTALHERLDAESAQRVMKRYYDALGASVDAHGGTVVKLLGDGVMAAFGLRRVAEDDAIRAVHAAVAMQEAFRELVKTEPALTGAGLRVAVNTGEVVVSGALDDVIGDPVNVAARLQEQGRDGDVVVGEATRRLVAALLTLAPLGSVALKGRTEAVAAYRVESLEAPATIAAPFVGRDDELAHLVAVYDTAVSTKAARLAVLLGSPGLGKSRLIDELGERLGAAVTVLAAHCDAAGGATFAPIATALRVFVGLDDAVNAEATRARIDAALATDDAADRARIAAGIAALLAGSPASPEETFFVVRRFLATLAREKPVVLVIDDIHWAESLLLDLVEHLIQWGSGVPLFVLAVARPELRDLRSSLVTPGGLVSDVVTLGGLDAGAAMRLAANVIGASDLPAAVAAKVLATSEGNPLFVGELVRMLVQEGALTKEGERWTASAGLATIEMPPTIHALLAARIERLRPEERTVLERASVVGRHFSRSAVAALLGQNGTELDARLESLRRSELIERDTGWLLGEPALRFHHVLIRDAAYRRLLKETRAELHERLADWIEAQVGDAPEHDETIGRHFEQAHQHLRELGALDAHGRTLGERASNRLAEAGRRALARDDVSLAAGLLGRAIDCLENADDSRAELALDWCEALLSAGDVGPAASAIAELERFAERSDRLRGWHTCFAGQLAVMTAPEELHAAAERVAAAASALAKLGDAAGEAKAHFVHAQALARLGKVGACEAALDQALAAARRAGDRRRANAVLAGAPLAALWGPSPVTRASGRCLDVVRVLRITQGAPAVEAVALSCQGVLEALRGRTDAARRMLASSRTMVEELGITQRLFEVDAFIGRVDLLEENAVAAERSLRPAYEGFRDLGLGIDAARAAALLGRALLEQNRAAEAEQLSHESELLAGDDIQAAIAWRGVRAEALAARGEHAVAVVLAKAAVDIAAATDALLDHAAARVALAAALRAAGRVAEANAESRLATELWEAKGATLLVEQVGRVVAEKAATVRSEAPSAATPTRLRRRVRANAATAVVERDTALIESGADEAAMTALFNEAFEEINHPTGSTYGRDAAVASIARLMRSRDVHYSTEPLATLGPRLMLGRRRIRASGTRGQRFDVGEYENETLSVHEVDGEGRHLRHEAFAADQLTEAITRLYERYAESLPEGPGRVHATTIARSVGVWLGPPKPDRFATAVSPTFEAVVDHRIFGTWSARSGEEMLAHWRWQAQLVERYAKRENEVLALEPAALLVRETYYGIVRDGGGAFENVVLLIWIFGADGLLARAEAFEPDDEARALERFAVLTAGGVDAGATTASRTRRITANAVTERAAEDERVVRDRDFDGLETLYGGDAVCIDHPNGATYGPEAMRTGMRRLMQSPDPRLRVIPLATLGPSWGLVRREMSASGSKGASFDVGPYEIVVVAVHGTDASGRLNYVEIFPHDQLRAAVVRLYECYAESLPEGPERKRASGIAATIAGGMGLLDDPDRAGARMAASMTTVDHRTLGAWSARGREQNVAQWRAQQSLAAELSIRDDDILALSATATAFQSTWHGVLREGGGRFENVVIAVHRYDADGLNERTEIFDSDREAEALACFDELTSRAESSPVRRRVRANAASRSLERFRAALAARDGDAVAETFDESVEVVHHPTAAVYGRRQLLTTWRSMLKAAYFDFRGETLATLGDTLALDRHTIVVEGFTEPHLADVGRMEHEELTVVETDGAGRWLRVELFAAEHLDDAMIRLYEIHAERLPEGRARDRGTATARARATHWRSAATDPDRFITSLAPTIVAIDHRTVGFGNLSGAEVVCAAVRTILDLSYEVRWRIDDVLALSEHTSLVRATQRGHLRAGGGEWERPISSLTVHDEHGLISRWEIFEPEREAEALARIDELNARAFAGTERGETGASVPVPNVASEAMDRWHAAFDAGFETDVWDAMRAVCAPGMTFDDRRRLALLSGDVDLMVASARERARMGAKPERRLRGTAGARVVIEAILWIGGPSDGRFEIEYVGVIEVDAAGLITAMVMFDLDDLGAAKREVYKRWQAIDPAAPAGLSLLQDSWEAFGAHDQGRLRAAFADDLVVDDHRRTGAGRIEGADAYADSLRPFWELAPDQSVESGLVWFAYAPYGGVTLFRRWGTLPEGGAFESEYLALFTSARGRLTRFEYFELDDLDAALARFEALRVADAAGGQR